MNEIRCEKTDLPVETCAHCTGATGVGVVDWTTTNPVPLPRAVPAPEAKPRESLGYYSLRILRELAEVYVRLHDHLPAMSTGRSEDNAAPFAAKPDPRRAPVRIEVHDLIAEIEADVPALARSVCDITGLLECFSFPLDSDGGAPEISPKVAAALATLDHHWPALERVTPEMAEQVESRLTRMVLIGERLIGVSVPPVPMATICPLCTQPTMFRVLGDREWMAVCANPECRDEYGRRHQWTETEWEDAHPRNRSSASGVH